MEADFTQYTLTSQEGGGLTYQEAGQLMKDMISAIKTNCPSAYFSIDISPWRDTTWQKNWYAALGMSQFSFIHTSGGSSRGDTEFISDSWSQSLPKWAWTYRTFNKPIFADAGYGVGGAGTGHDVRWDNVNNLRNRINDGVFGLAQVNPASNWASTISSLRSQLPTPPSCTGTPISEKAFAGKSNFTLFVKDNMLRTAGDMKDGFTVALYTLKGEIVYRKFFAGQTILPLALDLTGGSYLLEVKSTGKVVLKDRIVLAD